MSLTHSLTQLNSRPVPRFGYPPLGQRPVASSPSQPKRGRGTGLAQRQPEIQNTKRPISMGADVDPVILQNGLIPALLHKTRTLEYYFSIQPLASHITGPWVSSDRPTGRYWSCGFSRRSTKAQFPNQKASPAFCTARSIGFSLLIPPLALGVQRANALSDRRLLQQIKKSTSLLSNTKRGERQSNRRGGLGAVQVVLGKRGVGQATGLACVLPSLHYQSISSEVMDVHMSSSLLFLLFAGQER